jgi:YD repeat-containing protein
LCEILFNAGARQTLDGISMICFPPRTGPDLLMAGLYDLDDRVIDRADADGREFVNAYDSAGRLLTRQWPNTGVDRAPI